MDTFAKEYLAMMEQMRDMVIANRGYKATHGDKIPSGIGEFGLDVTNPIPVSSVAASMAYLTWLKTSDGKPVSNERIGSVEAQNIPVPIDAYRISQNGRQIAIIYICPYNYGISKLAPKGFMLIP